MCTCDAKRERGTQPSGPRDEPNTPGLDHEVWLRASTPHSKSLLTVRAFCMKSKRTEALCRRLCTTGRARGRCRTCSLVASTWEGATTRSVCIKKASSFRCSPRPVPSPLPCEIHSSHMQICVVLHLWLGQCWERVTTFEYLPRGGVGIPRKYFFSVLFRSICLGLFLLFHIVFYQLFNG